MTVKIGDSIASVSNHTEGSGDMNEPRNIADVTGRIAYVRLSVFSTGAKAARLNYTHLI